MTLDFATLEILGTRHPAWRLLRSDHAPLVASFAARVRRAQPACSWPRPIWLKRWKMSCTC